MNNHKMENSNSQSNTQPEDQQQNVVMNVDSTQENTGEDVNATKEVSVRLLNNLRALLTVAGDRGIFKTAEMYGVGLVYTELSNILDAK